MSDHRPIGAFDSDMDRIKAELPYDSSLPHNQPPKKSNWWQILIAVVVGLLALAYLIFGTSCHRVESTRLLIQDSLEIARRDTVYPYLWPSLQTDIIELVGGDIAPLTSPSWFQFYKDSITIKERPDGPTWVKLEGVWRNKRQFIDNRCGPLFVQILSPLEVSVKAGETWYKFSVSQ